MRKFNNSFPGYNKNEVNSFVSNVTTEYESMLNNLKARDNEINNLKKELEHFRNIENTLNRAILIAEESSQNIKKTAFDESRVIIEDAKRKVASFYNKKDFVIVNKFSDIYERLIKTNKEIEYEQLWKCFFENVNIKERKNLRCQRNFMPKKYWKNILEVTK